ncbi:MAG: hypothetical protein MJE66_02815 [Proteobacteria bacterium]|nr:hypothetical protein [Pseudomonadota bacterium]
MAMPLTTLRALVILLAVPLAACETLEAQFSGKSSTPLEIEAAGQHGIVLGPVSAREDSGARRLAEAHCAKQGLAARIPRMVGPSSVHYQCLP